MLNKSLAFGLLAAGLMLPSAAFAQDIQSGGQTAIQNGGAGGTGNTVVNNSTQTNTQDITKLTNGVSCASGLNIQSANQGVAQNGTAVGIANTVINQAQQLGIQNATTLANGYNNCF